MVWLLSSLLEEKSPACCSYSKSLCDAMVWWLSVDAGDGDGG
jgi:hypothetical protein